MLRDLKVLLIFCDRYQIDLSTRMLDGRLLELGELDALVRMYRLPLSAIEADRRQRKSKRTGSSRRAPRGFPCPSQESPSRDLRRFSQRSHFRIRYIRQYRQYLGWLADRRVLTLAARHPARLAQAQAKNIVVSALTDRSSPRRERSQY
ncbi:hypothetical protein BRCH_02492c [Candidatus Burkholderia brachyanthoides]|nr:hypothetical protein BRCH_02492c [Candidatus Burkholderia brachyanthoides]